MADQCNQINLPCYDMLEHIFTFLPIKSLHRFKAVCKSTRDLISSPTFVKCHAVHPNRAASQIHISRSQNPFRRDAEAPWYVTVPSLNSGRFNVHVAEFGNYFKAHITYVFGSCNGLLLVAKPDESFLWNPSIREYIKLPILTELGYFFNTDRYGSTKMLVGLGHDSVADDYKVVFNIDSNRAELRNLLIYSLKTGLKKVVVPDFRLTLYHNKRGVTVNGCPHWIIRKYYHPFTYNACTFDRVVLIYFDIMKEKLKSLSTPIEWFCDYPGYEPNLGTLSGRLCATLIGCAKSTTDVWVMNEFGVGDSWTKLFAVSHSLIWEAFRPLGFIKNGDEVVLALNKGEIVSYNHKTGKQKVIRRAAMNLLPHEFQFAGYTESLVSPRTFVKISRKRKGSEVPSIM